MLTEYLTNLRDILTAIETAEQKLLLEDGESSRDPIKEPYEDNMRQEQLSIWSQFDNTIENVPVMLRLAA